MSHTISMEEQGPPKQEIHEFLKQIDALSDPEAKLRKCIYFMRTALAQEKTPNFKGFWEVRKRCLPLFKEPLVGPLRSKLWGEYIELTREGRRLKNLLDEETAFAVEQIDLAIAAIEKEVIAFHEHSEEALKGIADVVFSNESTVLQKNIDYYQSLQKKLNALNVFASRINGLRKELIRTEMRIRQKNQFFARLSQLGDKVFPIRKELIREVSESFLKDVEEFAEKYFSAKNISQEDLRRSVFFFREEIKILQATAKILTLNTHAFSITRERLSFCWDQLKGMEKERKKEFAETKQKSSENVEELKSRIQQFVNDYKEGKYTLKQGFQELDTISRSMRQVELTRQHVRLLKEELEKAREPLENKEKEEEEIRKQKQEEFEKARKEKQDQLKKDIEALSQKVAKGDLKGLAEELETCRKTLASISMMKVEKQAIERRLKTLRDQISEKQEQALIELSDDDRAALKNLEEILHSRKKRRKEIKAQIEEYRKSTGGSGLDLKKQMHMQELMNAEKKRLAQLDEGILEIEKKIRELKTRA